MENDGKTRGYGEFSDGKTEEVECSEGKTKGDEEFNDGYTKE